MGNRGTGRESERRARFGRATRVGRLLLAGGLLAACSALRSERKLDAAPFAESMISVAGEAQRYNRPPQWVYLSAYQHLPSVERVRLTAVELRKLFRSIALYSTQVVALHEARLDESRRVAELASYIDEVARPGILSSNSSAIGIDAAEYESILARVRSKHDLRQALGAAQPLVTAVTNHASALFDRADEEVASAAEDMRQQVDRAFGAHLENLRDLEDARTRVVQAFNLVYQVRLGATGALARLLEVDPDVRPTLPADGPPSQRDLDLVEERLAGQLERMRGVREQLEPDFQRYQAHLAELDALRTQTEEMLRIGRLAMVVWSRSHRNLAAGIPIPPDVDILELVSRAAKLGKDLL